MTLKEELLLMLSYVGPKVVSKTRVVKYAYFLGELLGGGERGFRPHFYGPYSEQISSALGVLAFLGLVEQKRTEQGRDARGYEKVLYEYSLTPEGTSVVESLVQQHPARAKSVRDAAAMLSAAAKSYTYMALSCAAKAHYLLKAEGGKTMTVGRIVEKAKSFNWQLTPTEVNKSADLLVALKLAKKGG